MTQAVASWPRYCWKNGYSPEATEYLIAYILRRVRGAMLDALRSQDWVTRSARTRAKQLRSAGQDMGLGEAELAAAAGMSVQEVRDTIAAVAARPVSLDAEPHDVAAADSTESQAVVSSILAAAAGALAGFPLRARALVALRYYYGLSTEQAAAVLEAEAAEATRWHEEAITAMHSAMVRAVT
jgi:RNA polymerase sigma factor for flagellar operon FliA